MAPREILIEFQRIGRIVKVVAVDAETLTEVVLQGPASAGLEMLRRNAVAKLNYVLSRKSS